MVMAILIAQGAGSGFVRDPSFRDAGLLVTRRHPGKQLPVILEPERIAGMDTEPPHLVRRVWRFRPGANPISVLLTHVLGDVA